MSPDTLSVAVRSLSFVLLFQAAGAALFAAVFAAQITATRAAIRRLAGTAAVAGLVVITAHLALEATRMTGDFSGLTDLALQRVAWTTSNAAAHAMQALGLLLVAASMVGRGDAGMKSGGLPGVVGAAIAVGGFLLTGHTSTHAARIVLAPLLALHLLVVAFWSGALLPLWLVVRREPLQGAAAVLREFSALATWLVPLIAVAGLAMALLLAAGVPSLHEPYGALLLVKLGGFALLMILAACNKWRWTPALATGAAASRRALQRSVIAEFVLIAGVLAVTAVMTTFYSPGE
jgi:putative copper export protein